ncbi:MAG: 30S ribosomal protein S18, partial [Desulfomonilia bacterium]|nr:30S ribosomal protein S18 [Desulfomonilia bacterium]
MQRRPSNPRPRSRQKPYYKRKTCRFCEDKSVPIDYKAAHVLKDFITDRGKILPRRITGTCSGHQKKLTVEI